MGNPGGENDQRRRDEGALNGGGGMTSAAVKTANLKYPRITTYMLII